MLKNKTKDSFNIIDYINQLPHDESYDLIFSKDADMLFENMSGYEYNVEEKYDLFNDEYVTNHAFVLFKLQPQISKWINRRTTKNHISTLEKYRDHTRLFLDAFTARYVINLWTKNKQVYKFNEELCDKLLETDIEEYDLSYFDKLPYDDLFLQFEKSVDGAIGCFIHINHNKHINIYKGVSISIYLIPDSSTSRQYGTLPTQYNVITVTYDKKSFSSISGSKPTSAETEQYIVSKYMSEFILNCLIFINVGNSDIVKSKSVVKYKSYDKKKNKIVKRETVIENNKLVVKTRYYGDSVKQNNVCNEGTKHSNHKSPVTHMRRGHYHHHWVGAKGNKKLVLMWHEPVIVNINNEVNTNILTNNVPTKALVDSL